MTIPKKIYYFQFQRAITPTIRNPELRFFHICVKFHENTSNGFLVTERTRFCDRQTDGQTNQGKKNMSPNSTGGDITTKTKCPVRPQRLKSAWESAQSDQIFAVHFVGNKEASAWPIA